MRWIACVGAAALGLLLAAPAAASCRQWGRLDAEGKTSQVTEMIQSVVNGNRARQFQIPPAQIERCAMGKLEAIVHDIDDACSDGRTADKQAPRRTVDTYIRSCVSNRPR